MYRDIGGSDPERMAAPRVAEYVQECLKGTYVKVDVVSDLPTLEKNYPLLAAVNRCAHGMSTISVKCNSCFEACLVIGNYPLYFSRLDFVFGYANV